MCVELAVNLCAQVAHHYGVAPVVFDDLRWRWVSAWVAWIRLAYAWSCGSWLILLRLQVSKFDRADPRLGAILSRARLLAGEASFRHETALRLSQSFITQPRARTRHGA